MRIEPSKFETKVKANLDASVYALDNETQQALTSIRKKALEKQRSKSRLNFNAWISNTHVSNRLVLNTWIPAGAFALCALLTVLVVYSPDSIDDSAQLIATQQSVNHNLYEQTAMLELLTHPEDLETATDPDFYVWMEEVLATEDTDNAV